ncbi:uncharacterized protein HRG_10856 [Hirsutella rhossiliensis]|uniref:Uncharacterized protein n=1 Tax=Hirsutella rhossiliensis TaxID=111463 RepID=A0A9P8SEL4_9HYPO|nr:uncharacterized protein HRG_10856 [Hirsutella rhossiliensis]KAH0958161.1 hypothetical protein HRG_10856 [Hirsutella rhossiliensis]
MSVGAGRCAQVEAPAIFKWPSQKYDLPSPRPKDVIQRGTCPDLRGGDPKKRRRAVTPGLSAPSDVMLLDVGNAPQHHQLTRRERPAPSAPTLPGTALCENTQDGGRGRGDMIYRAPVYHTSGTLLKNCPNYRVHSYKDRSSLNDFRFESLDLSCEKPANYQTNLLPIEAGLDGSCIG